MNTLGIAPVLRSLGLSRASFYRCHRPSADQPTCEALPSADTTLKASPTGPCRVPGRALSLEERQSIRDLLYGERFMDRTPTEVYATLLDEAAYHCSPRTMYRLLNEDGPCKARTRSQQHSHYYKPELLATQPNQLWSWDITRLKGPRTWTYFHLYVVLDVFSRYVVAWMVAERESQQLATQLIDQGLANQQIEPGTLTIHADRGAAMTSKSIALLLSDLGVTKTHSRPHTSNDNPYSEAQFKTLKYRPDFPARFGSLQDARNTCTQFFQWYNTQHHHGGIALLTPETVHYNRAEAVINQRQKALNAAFIAHPERFVNCRPVHPSLPQAVWINPPPNAPDLTEEPLANQLDL